MGKKRTLVMGDNATEIRAIKQTASVAYTLDVEDANCLLQSTSASAAIFTIPANVNQEFDIGEFVRVQQYGAGTVTMSAGAGVTLRNGLTTAKPIAQYAVIQVLKIAKDEWCLMGNAG